jgi:non-heme chloroperoxidase
MNRFVEVAPGVRVFVQDLGSGRPVVLLPGVGMSHQVFDDLVLALTANHRVVAVDPRGTGQSDKPLNGYETATFASDVHAVLRQLDLSDVTILGWSFGGQVAFQAAIADDARLAQLVLVCSNAVSASRTDGFPFGLTADKVLPGMMRDELGDRLAARRETIRAGFAVPPRSDLLDRLVTLSLSMPPWAALRTYESYLTTDLSDAVGALHLPTLQVVGARDPALSARGAAWLAGELKTSRLVEMPECGHYPMYEASEGFTEVVTEFVARLP